MTVDILVPALGESVAEATVAKWLKTPGEAVEQDEVLVELETEKVNLEVNAPVAGVLAEVAVPAGRTVAVGALLGRIAPAAAPARPVAALAEARSREAPAMSPAARKLAVEHDLAAGAVAGSGKAGRVLKEDVLAAVQARAPRPEPAPSERPEGPRPPVAEAKPAPPASARERRVPMSRLRRAIARRLKEAQNAAALLTTFNEVDMSALRALRAQYRDGFEKKHGVRLGLMSFFVKASVAALKEQPVVNAEIDGEDIVYKDYYHIGVAVGAPQGLVVPVLREADRMGFGDIERAIAAFAEKAAEGKLLPDDMTGGTFTISNGGIYGSMLSTPILNAPQSAILGMHKIVDRPVAVAGRVEVRPVMYLALSYDHRLIDGREAVTFLLRIKDCIEDPQRLLLDV